MLFLSAKQHRQNSKFLKWPQISKERKAAIVGLTTNNCALYHTAFLPKNTHTRSNPNLPITNIMATTNWSLDRRGT